MQLRIPVSCPDCGADVPEGARFCTRCGAALAVPVPETAAPTAVIRPVGGEDDDEDDDPTDPDAPIALGASTSPDLVECRNCGAPNSLKRTLCGRCGADLVTGAVTPTRHPPVPLPGPTPAGPEADTGPVPRRDRPRRAVRTAFLVIGIGVLLGALIGGLVALEVGPFADGQDQVEVPPAPPFEPARYAEEASDLPVAAIGASSTAADLGDTSFAAANMLDSSLTTAWNNDGSQNPTGVGEVIALEFDRPVWVTRVILANGSQRDDARFRGDARLKRARLTFDGGDVVEISFLDQQGYQAATLDEPRLTTGVRLDVLEVYPGDTYDELAVSELRFEGHVADARDAAVAEERAGTTGAIQLGVALGVAAETPRY